MKKLILLITFTLFVGLAHADEYYLTQWVAGGELATWTAPYREYRVGTLDMRSETEAASDIVAGWAFFAYNQKVPLPDSQYLGNDLDAALTPQQKAHIRSTLKTKALKFDNLRDILYEILTENADPTGADKVKPLMPNRKMELEIYFGTKKRIKKSKLVPFVSQEWGVVLATMHNDYKRLVRTEPLHEVAKQLDYWEEKFGVHYTTFVPHDSIQLASLPHATSYTESFDCANSADPSCDYTWTELATGDLKIDSNELEIAKFCCANAHNTIRLDQDLSGDDHYAEIDVVTGNAITAQSVPNWYGTIVRKDSANTATDMDFYQGRYRHRSDASTDTFHIYEWTDNSDAELTSDITGATTPSYPFTIKTEIDGNTIKFYVDGVEKLSTTDTSITSNTRTGVWAYKQHSSNQVNMDSFTTADLGAALERRIW